MNIVKRIYQWIVGLGVLLAFVMAIIYFLLMYCPIRVIDINGVEILNENGIVKAGEMLNIQLSYKKYINSPATRIYEFHNRITYFGSPTWANIPFGEHTYVLGVLVPSELPPDTYSLRIQAVYQINVLRTYKVSFETKKFIVVKE